MIEPTVRQRKDGFWDVIFFGRAYNFFTEGAARYAATVEEIVHYPSEPVNWEDYYYDDKV